MMRRGTIFVVFALAACVIDGVPLPDETDDHSEDTTDTPSFTGAGGVFATRSAGVTLVFGIPGTVEADATIVVISGERQARSSAAFDGSFNVALSGDLADTINVSVVIGGKQVGSTTLDTPLAGRIFVPDGSPVAADTILDFAATNTTRLDPTRATVVFPAGSFTPNVKVAIANLDRGTTETTTAAEDGSLSVDVSAATGDTLYVMALTNTAASSPYILTAP